MSDRFTITLNVEDLHTIFDLLNTVGWPGYEVKISRRGFGTVRVDGEAKERARNLFNRLNRMLEKKGYWW